MNSSFNPRFIIADHVRAIVFIVAEGVLPSGKGRGYVLRRLMRRLISGAHSLRIDITNKMFYTELVDAIIAPYKHVFPEVLSGQEKTVELLLLESQKYLRAIEVGKKEWKKILSQIGDSEV